MVNNTLRMIGIRTHTRIRNTLTPKRVLPSQLRSLVATTLINEKINEKENHKNVMTAGICTDYRHQD